ncbi:hypothetical protein DFJ77DRAFT_461269 [Powellomyces hirtus]|nr:hypothetical protein DFJ77DRAFT_461269 [Powellomyces hirtus]
METGEGTIHELAKESVRQERKSWIPAVPLTILAPVLVALALTGVLLPNTYILNHASESSTSHLAGKYLANVLSDVKTKVESPVKQIDPIIRAVANNPDINATFSGGWGNFANSPAISNMVLLKDSLSLDSIVCLSARFKTGYNQSNAYPPTIANAEMVWLNAIALPGTSTTVMSILDVNNQTHHQAYVLDPYTRAPSIPPSRTGFSYDPSWPSTALLVLGFRPSNQIPRAPIFTINSQPGGLKIGFLSLLKFGGTNPYPSFSCSAGFRVDTSWNNILRAAKPTDSSIVTLFATDASQNFVIAASSNMILSGTYTDPVTKALTWGSASEDPLTLELRDALKSRFSNFTVAMAATKVTTEFELSLSGQRWIVNIGIAQMSAYDSYLVVAGIPRYEIYGEIDKARNRSRLVSFGISFAMAIVVAGIFVLVALPLMSLARQMEQLTKLDFGSLDSSGALDRRSWIWELRKVQIVFSTMVRAFAGAIKKNKQMSSKAAFATSSTGGGPGASQSRIGTEASTKQLTKVTR